MRDATLEVYPAATQMLAGAAARDGRFAWELVTAAARLAVGAWAMACNGDDAVLATLGEPQPLCLLMDPPYASWRVAPGPVVRHVTISRAEPDREPAQALVRFDFAGRRLFSDPGQAASDVGDEIEFAGTLTLMLADGHARPWRILRGSVDTLDHFLGWVFTSRPETLDEFRERTGSSADAAIGSGPLRTFRLTSGFAEHDEKAGMSATVDVRLAAAPDRYQAEGLIQPEIWAVTVRRLGEGDWHPSMNWLDVIELLEPVAEPGRPQPGTGPTGPDRAQGPVQGLSAGTRRRLNRS